MIKYSHKEILQVVIEKYTKEKRPIKSSEIAKEINKDSGTVRNLMIDLNKLGLIIGIAGPKGGYIPTEGAFKSIFASEDIQKKIPVYINGELKSGLIVYDVFFMNLSDVDNCNGIIKAGGELAGISQGDHIQFGPTPVRKIMISGIVEGVDLKEQNIFFELLGIATIPNTPVRWYSETKILQISVDTEIKEAIQIMANNGEPYAVVADYEKLLGVVWLKTIINEMDEKKTLEDVVLEKIIIIDADESIVEALYRMAENDVESLLVVDNYRPMGVITRERILREVLLGERYR
jgi:hypothetical protein